MGVSGNRNQGYKYLLLLKQLLVLCLVMIGMSSAFAAANNFPMTGMTTNKIAPSIDQRIISLMKRWGMPGGAIVIMRDDQILHARGYGWADKAYRQPVYPNSLFRIGSVSKAITAVAVLKLIQDQRVGLDDKVFSILNDLHPLGDHTASGVYSISVRNLLQMSPGWYSTAIDPMFGPWSSTMLSYLNNDIPPDCVMATRMMMGLRLHYQPGTRYSYSNLGYCMLGLIVTKATNVNYGYMGYENYVKQNILEPLGIMDMQIGDTLSYNRAKHEVKYYPYPTGSKSDPYVNNVPESLANLSGLPYGDAQILHKNAADGGWIASALDLARFLQALSSFKILNPDMVKIMLSRPSFEHSPDKYWSMGWVVERRGNHSYFSKHGSFTGTQAMIFQSDDGTSYAAIFNAKPTQRPKFLAELVQILISSTK